MTSTPEPPAPQHRAPESAPAASPAPAGAAVATAFPAVGAPQPPAPPPAPAPGTRDLPPGRAPEAPAPRSAGRVLGLDLARGIAVLGMVVAHIGYTTDDLSTLEGWLGFAHGRSSILFALLAGVSLGILTGGRTPHTGVRALQARTRILVRGVLLLVFGAVLSMIETPVALILGAYAVWFMFSLPFHRWGARRLLTVGAVWLVVSSVTFPYLQVLLYRLGLTTDGWDANAAVLDAMFGLYTGLVWYGLILVGMGIARLDLRSVRTVLVLLAAGLVSATVGYGAGHLVDGDSDPYGDVWDDSWDVGTGDVGTGQISGQMTWMEGSEGAPEEEWADLTEEEWVDLTDEELEEILGGGAWEETGDEPWDGPDNETWQMPGVPGITYDPGVPFPDWRLLTGAHPHTSTPGEMLGSGGVALAILAVCLLLPRVVHTILLPVRAVGTMSLSAYCGHVVAIAWWPDTFMDWSGTSNRPAAILAGAVVVACLAWYLLLGRGPLERVMHSVSVRAARVDAGPAPAVAAAAPHGAPATPGPTPDGRVPYASAPSGPAYAQSAAAPERDGVAPHGATAPDDVPGPDDRRPAPSAGSPVRPGDTSRP